MPGRIGRAAGCDIAPRRFDPIVKTSLGNVGIAGRWRRVDHWLRM